MTSLNGDVAWDDFNSREYNRRNYLFRHPDDEEILSLVRDHFSDHFRKSSGRVGSGIDVGAGPNLYPALAMLPWCDRVTLLERSLGNVRYLKEQRDSYEGMWDKFWDVLCKEEAYRALGVDPRVRFREAVDVREGDIFDLARGAERWDLGTMFFVAESITESVDQFRLGVASFMTALKPGAPFAAAFMENSKGYYVDGRKFPATSVRKEDVGSALKGYADSANIYRLGTPDDLREGYTGMIVAYGRRNG